MASNIDIAIRAKNEASGAIRQVSVRYRTGLLGARTLLAVEPATN